MSSIQRVINNSFFPLYQGEDPEEYRAAVDAHARQVRQTGATHVMVNQALVSIPWAMDPENSYLRFSEYGYSLDKYVTSTWNAGIYHEPLLKKNRDILLKQAEWARTFGFRCAIRCVEIAFMPESFYRRHPSLRGPRIDNPICSTTPLYAPCAMLPEVQDHYRQLIRKILTLVPEIDEMHIFTNDSGAGFCYSSHLYAGSNGPVHCRKISPVKQAQTFCRVLAETGREINPEFRVVMTSGLSLSEKMAFVGDAPEGVVSDVYGAFAWGGGLEDHWANMAVGPAIYNNPEERRKAREWARADYQARVEPIRRSGKPVYVNYSSEYYAGDDPRPYETHGIMRELLELGTEVIIGGAPGWTPYSINSAVIRRAIREGDEETDKAVASIAEEWVGAALAPKLCEAWKRSDHAAREWPVPASGGHAAYLQPLLVDMPIVPDEERLAPDALNYFMTSVLLDEHTMKGHQGGVWRILHYDRDTILAYLKQYEEVVFPEYEQALAILREALESPMATDRVEDCLREQHDTVAAQLLARKRLAHWFMAALHRKADCTPPEGFPSLREIIDSDIALCEELGKGPPQGDPSSSRPILQSSARPERIALMRQHRDDPLRKVDLSEFPVHTHPGCDGWEGAHR